jgi:hypothetical protein
VCRRSEWVNHQPGSSVTSQGISISLRLSRSLDKVTPHTMNKRRNDQTPPTEYEDDYCLSGKRSTSSMMEDTGGPKQLFSVEMTLLLCLNRNTLIPTAVARNVLSFLYIRIDNTSIRDAMAIMHADPALSLVLYGHISFWETSRVTDMSSLFYSKKVFNKTIERWDVRNVTNMERVRKANIELG